MTVTVPIPLGLVVAAVNAKAASIAPAPARFCPTPVTLVLPYPISANRYWRPVRIGKHITIVPTTEAKAYRHEVAVLARKAGVYILQGRLALAVLFSMGCAGLRAVRMVQAQAYFRRTSSITFTEAGMYS